MRRSVGHYFRVPPPRARQSLRVFKGQGGRRPPQIIPREQRLPARAQVLLYVRIVFLSTRRALQFNNVQRFCHHRESLAPAFFPTANMAPNTHKPHSTRPTDPNHNRYITNFLKIAAPELRATTEPTLPHT